MAILRNDNRDKVYRWCIDTMGMTKEGAAGFLGNLFSESGVDPTCVEGLLCQRYSEDGDTAYKRPVNTAENIKYNNALYTARIDSGKYPRSEFLTPRGGHRYGYGLNQATTPARKQLLWDHTISRGKSIGDLEGQLAYLADEFHSMYPKTLAFLQKTASVFEASDYVLVHYEAPANVEGMKATRRNYSMEFYRLYEGVNLTVTAEDVMKIALSYEGTIEKPSGSNNVKFNTDYYGRQVAGSAYPWCCAFVWDVFRMAGASSLFGPKTAACATYESHARARGESVGLANGKYGDVVTFDFGHRKGYAHHIGMIVKKIGPNQYQTIEGNTSVTSNDNGGKVMKRTRSTSDMRYIFRPKYAAPKTDTPKAEDPAVDYSRIFSSAYYLSKYPDVRMGWGGSALDHYTRYGAKEGRCPSATFDPAYYRKTYKDLDQAFGDRWEEYPQHYLTFGIKEGRAGAPAPKEAAPKPEKTGIVQTALNVRKFPRITAEKCKTFGPLKRGEKVTILKEVDGWYLIKTTAGKEGYASAKYIKV